MSRLATVAETNAKIKDGGRNVEIDDDDRNKRFNEGGGNKHFDEGGYGLGLSLNIERKSSESCYCIPKQDYVCKIKPSEGGHNKYL